jgi:hypothetical protein
MCTFLFIFFLVHFLQSGDQPSWSRAQVLLRAGRKKALISQISEPAEPLIGDPVDFAPIRGRLMYMYLMELPRAASETASRSKDDPTRKAGSGDSPYHKG